MTKLVFTFVIAIALLGPNSFADSNHLTSYLNCSNGSIEEVGDGLFSANFFDDGIELKPYEGSVRIEAKDITRIDSTASILNLQTTLYSEGIEYQVVVDAIITYTFTPPNPIPEKVMIAYSFDKEPFRSLILQQCQIMYTSPEK